MPFVRAIYFINWRIASVEYSKLVGSKKKIQNFLKHNPNLRIVIAIASFIQTYGCAMPDYSFQNKNRTKLSLKILKKRKMKLFCFYTVINA